MEPPARRLRRLLRFRARRLPPTAPIQASSNPDSSSLSSPHLTRICSSQARRKPRHHRPCRTSTFANLHSHRACRTRRPVPSPANNNNNSSSSSSSSSSNSSSQEASHLRCPPHKANINRNPWRRKIKWLATIRSMARARTCNRCRACRARWADKAITWPR